MWHCSNCVKVPLSKTPSGVQIWQTRDNNPFRNMISNKSKWKCNSGWYVHLYSFVYAAQQQGGYHPPFKLRGKLVLLLLLLGFEIFYQKPCRWFDPLFQCVCILKKISLLISSLAAKNHTPSPHKPKSHPLARDWELAHLCWGNDRFSGQIKLFF